MIRFVLAVPACAVLVLGACATQPAGQSDVPADDSSGESASTQANQGAGARPIVRPTERTTPRIDPNMTSSGSTALARPVPPPTTGTPQAAAEDWQPEWFTGSVTEHDGTAVGSTVATHRDLLEARRQAVTEAVALIRDGKIAQTATRQLSDGRFRVWVRISAEAP